MENQEAVKFLSGYLSATARQRVEKMIRGKKIQVTEVEVKNESQAFGEQMSIIMLWSSVGAIFLKIHFNFNVASMLASGGLEKPIEEVNRDIALDFMKECSNGVGGFVRSSFESNQLLMGMSLPFLAEGKDEVIFRKIRDSRAHCTAWHMQVEGAGEFYFTSEVCLLDPSNVSKIRPQLEEALAKGEESDNSGEVEFLF